MAWELKGTLIEACSCKSACPCVLGPAEPDQGWCSGALTFVIEAGRAGDLDLGGRTVVWLIDLPADFASGNGTARLYIDDGADGRQRAELEAIFQGRRGGPGEVLGSLVDSWLPTKTAAVVTEGSEEISLSVGDVGKIEFKPIKDANGKTAALINAPVLGLVQIDRADLARGDGSHFADPEMREWASGGHASRSPFGWTV